MTLCSCNPCTPHQKSAQHELGERYQTLYNRPRGVRAPSDSRHLACKVLLNGTLCYPASGNQDHCMRFEGSICQAGRPFMIQETGGYHLLTIDILLFVLFVCFCFCCTFCCYALLMYITDGTHGQGL